jgi:prepilin-type N-terminal cleavage/methylation domain-containing protein
VSDRSNRNLGQRGFTLLEMMIGVALVAVLVKLAVPMFTSETRKTKATSEVTAMFGELANREEMYKTDHGSYLVAAACPSTTSPSGTSAASCIASGQPWNNLHVSVPFSKLVCSYTISVGTASTTPAVPSGFSFTAPPESWYFITASCETDGKSGTSSSYFVASNDTQIQSQNVGK